MVGFRHTIESGWELGLGLEFDEFLQCFIGAVHDGRVNRDEASVVGDVHVVTRINEGADHCGVVALRRNMQQRVALGQHWGKGSASS